MRLQRCVIAIFILDVLRDVLPTTGVILEIASGSGEHIVHFAKNLPSLVFQPPNPDPNARLSIAAWVKATGVTNVRAPMVLDALHSVGRSHRLSGLSAST
jgi:tRNA G46 methylase TrmB